MEKILGLDLGTNSIGWTIRNPYLDESQFEKYGVNTFQTGVGKDDKGKYTISFAAERTKKRSIRRLYQVRKYRIWETLLVLISNDYCPMTIDELNQWRKYDKAKGLKRKYPVDAIKFERWVKLDFDGDGKPDYTSPYQIRKELIEKNQDLDNQIERYKIGRAFYHIAQRRGFKSSRKSGDKEKSSVYTGSKDSGARGVNEIKEYIEKYKTLGAALAFIETTGVRVRNQYTLRKHYEEEVKLICETQKLTETAFEKDLLKAIFYQRPLRSQKGLIGKCIIESSKARCPVSHPSFEEFRAWSLINNIQYKLSADKNVKWEKLSPELKKKIYQEKFFRKSKDYFAFEEIRELIQADFKRKGTPLILSYKDHTINYKDNTSVSACPVSAQLKDIFGEDWLNYKKQTEDVRKIKKKDGSFKEHKISYSISDIWHVLFSFDDEERLCDFAKGKLDLNDKQIENFKDIKLPQGYSMLSLNAINKILPFLRMDFIYTEAVMLANIPEVLGEKLWKENEKLLTDSISGLIEQNRNEKRILNIVNNLIARWKAMENKFGYKDASYKLVASDKKDISDAAVESYGKETWKDKDVNEKNLILENVTDFYQQFFNSDKREFFKLPHLLDTIKQFLRDNFDLSDKQLAKLYHPSQIEIYPKAKPDKEGKILLQSPKTGAFKNPMAMRTLHELRKIVNYLLSIDAIDEDTRIVVELARELNDANKRWAIETYQKRREEENREFEAGITELIKDPAFKGKADPKSDTDIDKFRIWFEQIDKIKMENGKSEDNLHELKKEPKKADTDSPMKHDWSNTTTKLYKLIKAKETVIEKYRLWKEQGCRCMYTGNMINLTDLFDENVIDFEHTIPRSISFDNSLANLTVCYADFNRNIKKNKLPTQLDNYKEIELRLDDWKKKVELITDNIEFWLKKSKRALDKETKDIAIRQRHLWQFERDYWSNKLDRFTKKEITSGFKNSQLVDTQIISKYALHYLRTVFNKVDVQKGINTAQFRKIYEIQPKFEKKDRNKHSHHAIDAAVLTLIPSAAKREEILKKAYEYEENNPLKQYHEKPYAAFNFDQIIEIENNILINNIAKDQALTPSSKIARKRGKIVYLRDGWKGSKGNFIYDKNGKKKEKIITGEAVRGQLHQETFFGAIKKVKRDVNDNPLKNSEGKFIFEEGLSYVVREPFIFKKDANSSGFKNLADIKSCIVDPHLYKMIEKQVGDKSLKDAIVDGIYSLKKNGEKTTRKIRHIRVFVKAKEPLEIKKQTYISNKNLKYLENRDHKQWYYAGNATNYAYIYYNGEVDGKQEKTFDVVNLKKVIDLNKLNPSEKKGLQLEIKEPKTYKKKGRKLITVPYYATLKVGQKVLFWQNKPEELKELYNENRSDFLKRIYKITSFEPDGKINFQYHLESRSDKEIEIAMIERDLPKSGASEFDFNNPIPVLRLSMNSFNFTIEGKDFEVKQNGKIDFEKAQEMSFA